tara:strand:- start:110 stop:496 length:387 start_codon:yes stop_codon:yes gene_type:complete
MIRNNRHIRRNKYRNNDREYRQNGSKLFKNNSNNGFQRKHPGRNNHNAPRLIEKYNDLAREALSNGDKILSENYFQHADHFLRVSQEQNLNSTYQKSNDNKNPLHNSNVDSIPNKENKVDIINLESKE